MAVDDARIWDMERGLWTGDADHYRELIDETSLFVVPTRPFVMAGSAAAKAMGETPRWSTVAFTEQQVTRPQEGLIVIAYLAVASAEGKDDYAAYCTTTMRRLAHDEWRVVQHQQTPPRAANNSRKDDV